MIRLRLAACIVLGLSIAPASASAQPSFSTTVSPEVATYPDTKELTYRVQVTTGDARERFSMWAVPGSGLRLRDVVRLEGPGSLTLVGNVTHGDPPPGYCGPTLDGWSQSFDVDLPPDSVSTLVFVMITGQTRQSGPSPNEYFFTLGGPAPLTPPDMPRVPVSGAAVPDPPPQPCLNPGPTQPVQPQPLPLSPVLAPAPVVRNTVNVLRGYARVHLRCDLGCKGTIRIKRHGKLLGQRGFHAAAGTNAVLWVPIKRQGRRMLARHKRLAADVAVQLPTVTHRTAIMLSGLDR